MINWFRHGPFAFWAVTVVGGVCALVLLGLLGTSSTDSATSAHTDIRWELLDAYGQTVGLEGSSLEQSLIGIADLADRCDEPICLNISSRATALANDVAAGDDPHDIFEGRLALGRLINQYVTNPGVTQ